MNLVYLNYGTGKRTKYNRGPKPHAVLAVERKLSQSPVTALCGMRVGEKLPGLFNRTSQRSCEQCKNQVARRDAEVA